MPALQQSMTSSVWVQNQKLRCWFQKPWLNHYKGIQKKKRKTGELSVFDFCGWGKLITDASILNYNISCEPYTLYSISSHGYSSLKTSFLVWSQTMDWRDIKSSSMHTFTTTKITAWEECWVSSLKTSRSCQLQKVGNKTACIKHFITI